VSPRTTWPSFPQTRSVRDYRPGVSLFRIFGGAETLGKLEECLLFLLLRGDALLDQFNQDAVLAEPAAGPAVDLM